MEEEEGEGGMRESGGNALQPQIHQPVTGLRVEEEEGAGEG